MRFREPPRNNSRMAFCVKLRGRSPSLQATRRNSLLWTIPIIRLPIHSLLAFQTSSCAALHRLSFSSPAPASRHHTEFWKISKYKTQRKSKKPKTTLIIVVNQWWQNQNLTHRHLQIQSFKTWWVKITKRTVWNCMQYQASKKEINLYNNQNPSSERKATLFSQSKDWKGFSEENF